MQIRREIRSTVFFVSQLQLPVVLVQIKYLELRSRPDLKVGLETKAQNHFQKNCLYIQPSRGRFPYFISVNRDGVIFKYTPYKRMQ